jgi:RimJ/RimL family protein N-acetyltransferase
VRKPDRLEGQRIDLLNVGPSFFENIVEWRNDPDTQRQFFSKTMLTVADQQRWHEAYRQDDSDMTFVLQLKGGVPIGMIGLYRIDRRAQTAEFGRLLIGERKYRGKGFAVEACRLLLHYGFYKLNLETIDLEVYDSNLPAIALYERLGFETVGLDACRDANGIEQRRRKMVLRKGRNTWKEHGGRE